MWSCQLSDARGSAADKVSGKNLLQVCMVVLHSLDPADGTVWVFNSDRR